MDRVNETTAQSEVNGALNHIMNKTNKSTIADITASVALVNLLTSQPDLVDPDLAVNVSNKWLPSALQTTIDIAANATDWNDGYVAEKVQIVGGIAVSLVRPY